MTAKTYKIGAREIERGQILEIETVSSVDSFAYRLGVSAGSPTPGPTTIGRLLIANEHDVLLEVLKVTKKIAQKDVRSVRVLTPEENAQRFHVGDNVRIDRFGNVYQGTVEKVGRTRVTVRFRTLKDKREGVSHVATVPSAELLWIRSAAECAS